MRLKRLGELSLSPPTPTGPIASLPAAAHVYSPDGERKVMIAAPRYQDTFVMADEPWRFAESWLYVRWTEVRTLEEAGVA